jgi:bifunctional non-homologous end joining protein LigD
MWMKSRVVRIGCLSSLSGDTLVAEDTARSCSHPLQAGARENPVVDVSNADRVVFPDPGITKGEVVAYYEAVGALMLRHAADRPVTLQRFPRGLSGPGFMQKNRPDHFPDTIEAVEVPRQEGGSTTYPVVTEPGDFAYLANQGTITFHVPTTRRPRLDRANRVIFDLDPPAGETAAVRRAAVAVREVLAGFDVPSTPMTSGSKGYHLYTVVEPAVSIDEAGRFALLVALLAAADAPVLLTTAFRIDDRDGKVFIDWLRNRPMQTGVAPWSLRPRPGAPVATPITWDQVDDVDPDGIRLGDFDPGGVADPLAEAESTPVDLRAAMRAVEEAAAASGLEAEPFDRFRS